MANLMVVEGPSAGRTFALAYHTLVMIGRDEGCSFQIQDERISRRHVQIKYHERDNRHSAVDAGSANGVLINGSRLEPGTEHDLKDGDEIAIGGSRIVYTRSDIASAEKALRGLRWHGERQRDTIFPGDGDA